MPLTGMSAEQLAVLESELIRNTPEDGSNVGNKTLRDEILRWDADTYLAVRKRLLDEGKLLLGRGKGGSVRRAPREIQVEELADLLAETVANGPVEQYLDEASLYNAILAVIRDRWVLDQSFDQVLVEITARGGRRPDGIWTRPDVSVAAMSSYTYVPGRHFDVVTFEVKHYSGLNITAVYEALAHRRSATRSYVLIYLPDSVLGQYEGTIVSEIAEEASRHGIGLITAGDPADFDSWDIREEAARVTPDPARMDAFIRNQFAEGTRDQIVRWFR